MPRQLASDPSPGAQGTTRSGVLLVAFAATGWGLWSLFFRPAEAICRIHPGLQALAVFAAQGLVTLPWVLRGASRERPLRAWLPVAYLGIGDALNAVLFFAAMQRTSLAVAVLSHYLAPLLVALLAPRVLLEAPRKGSAGALAIALGGLALMLEPWSAASPGMGVGAALGAGSAVFYAVNVLVTKRVQPHFSPFELLGFHVPTALLCLMLLTPGTAYVVDLRALLWVSSGAVLLGAVGGVIFLKGLERIDATRASVLTLLEPVSAMVVGVLVWHEPFGIWTAAGALLVLGALARATYVAGPRKARAAVRSLG